MKRCANHGKLTHGIEIEGREDGRGFPYYWLRFKRRAHEQRPGSDLATLSEQQISVTPLKLDLTDYDVQQRLVEALK